MTNDNRDLEKLAMQYDNKDLVEVLEDIITDCQLAEFSEESCRAALKVLIDELGYSQVFACRFLAVAEFRGRYPALDLID